MKKIIYLFGVIIILASCTSPEIKVITAKITGTVENANTDFLVLMKGRDAADTVKIDAEGKFEQIINIEEAGKYYFNIGKNYQNLYLTPGDELIIALDGDKFSESFKVSGKGFENSTFLIEKDRYFKANKLARFNYDMMKEIYPTFKGHLDSVQAVKTNFFENYFASHKIAQELLEEETISNTYDYATLILNYPAYYSYYLKEDMASEYQADYDNAIASFDLEKAEYLRFPVYVRFVEAYVNQQDIVDSSKVDHKMSHVFNKFASIDAVIKNQEIKNKLMNNSATSGLRYTGVNGFADVLDVFNAKCTDAEMKKAMNDLYDEYKELATGKPSPVFTGVDMEGNRVTLKDLSGKYVYVDVWATWCGPCKGEIPYLQELEKEYHGRNITFVSLSVDEDKEAWEKMVTEKSLGGIQIFADNNWKNDFVAGYKINGIPQFVMIDPEGKIVESNAPRPSGKIRELLEAQTGL